MEFYTFLVTQSLIFFFIDKTGIRMGDEEKKKKIRNQSQSESKLNFDCQVNRFSDNLKLNVIKL